MIVIEPEHSDATAEVGTCTSVSSDGRPCHQFVSVTVHDMETTAWMALTADEARHLAMQLTLAAERTAGR